MTEKSPKTRFYEGKRTLDDLRIFQQINRFKLENRCSIRLSYHRVDNAGHR